MTIRKVISPNNREQRQLLNAICTGHRLFRRFSSRLHIPETSLGFRNLKRRKRSGQLTFSCLIAQLLTIVDFMCMSARAAVKSDIFIYYLFIFTSEAFTYMGSKIHSTISTSRSGSMYFTLSVISCKFAGKYTILIEGF